ncbi:MAG TPA: hypothetical protein VF516_46180 [Kofleriaceae bacterium]
MIDWQQLLQGNLPAVHGVRVGDPKKAVPVDANTTTDAVEAGEWRRAGGPSFLDPCCFVLKNGRVARILVRGTLLDGLPIREQEDITRLFGEPLGIERIFRWRFIHYYPERQLSIAWNPVEKRVEQVAFGPVTWEPRMLSARDVLDEWLASDLSWKPDATEPSDRSSSAWVRWMRVHALLRGFQLGSPIEFARGEFLLESDPDNCPHACNAIRKHESDLFPWDREREQMELGHLFARLLGYRRRAHQLLQFNSGTLEAGFPGTIASIKITEAMNRRIATEAAAIDRLLVELIGPGDLRVAERDLEGWIYDDELKYLVEVETWGPE